MTYVPWPDSGCSLAEACERTAGRFVHSAKYGSSARADPETSAAAEPHASKQAGEDHCLALLRAGQLIGTGRQAGADDVPRVISANAWTAFRIVRWEASEASDGGDGGLTYSGISVFPPLLGPNRVELLADKPLAQVCRQFLFNDPEVAVLGAEAVHQSPDFGRVLSEARCHIHGVPEWPLAFERWSFLETVHPDPALRSIFDPDQPDPIEVVLAAEAIKHRYRVLISMLRDRQLMCRGIPVRAGEPSDILVSVWSYEDFHLDMIRGDILQDNPESTNRYDRFLKRWLAVVLERGPAEVRDGSELLHVKPLTIDGVRPSTLDRAHVQTTQKKGLTRVETTGAARKACVKWLVALMRQSPDIRTHTIPELWAEARSAWPGTLSRRAFLDARTEATRVIKVGHNLLVELSGRSEVRLVLAKYEATWPRSASPNARGLLFGQLAWGTRPAT